MAIHEAQIKRVGDRRAGLGSGFAALPERTRRFLELQRLLAFGSRLEFAEPAAHHLPQLLLDRHWQAVEQRQAQPVRHFLLAHPRQAGEPRVVAGDERRQIIVVDAGVDQVLLAQQQGQLPADDRRHGAGAQPVVAVLAEVELELGDQIGEIGGALEWRHVGQQLIVDAAFLEAANQPRIALRAAEGEVRQAAGDHQFGPGSERRFIEWQDDEAGVGAAFGTFDRFFAVAPATWLDRREHGAVGPAVQARANRPVAPAPGLIDQQVAVGNDDQSLPHRRHR